MNLLQSIMIFGALSLCIESNDGPQEMVTIDAAYSYSQRGRTYLVLFAGNYAQTLVDGKNILRWKRYDARIPSEMKLQAAHARPGNQGMLRFFGDKYGVNIDSRLNVKKFKYGAQRSFLRNGGPDAAAVRGGVVYFFKGCEMIVRLKFSKWGKVQQTSSIGLPCDIDAAWSENGQQKMVLLKGDKYWTWEQDDSVTGPHDFFSDYTLFDWNQFPSK